MFHILYILYVHLIKTLTGAKKGWKPNTKNVLYWEKDSNEYNERKPHRSQLLTSHVKHWNEPKRIQNRKDIKSSSNYSYEGD